jgi:hypothetical protein
MGLLVPAFLFYCSFSRLLRRVIVSVCGLVYSAVSF